jgi:predicted phage terminase large subunit-like protein
MAALMYVDLPTYSAIIIRKSYQDLAQPGCLIPISQDWLAGTKAHWSLKDFRWTFPSGATLSFGYLADEMSMYKYQGANYHTVIFDELTQHEERRYLYLFSRLRRKVDDGIPLRMRATSNPGGIGHEWVKQRFLDSADPDRVFIPAKLADNPFLDQKSYIQNLNYLDSVTRRQLLNGDWTARESGGKFRREWFKIVRDYPHDAHLIRAWDLAGTKPSKGKDPDYTAGVLMAEQSGIYYILDVRRMRGTPEEVEKLVKQTADLDPPQTDTFMEREPGSAGQNVISHYARNILKGYSFHEHRTTGDKELRANPMSSAAEAGNIRILPGEWVSQFLDELEAFPNGSHDDQVDASSLAFNRLSKPRGWIIM